MGEVNKDEYQFDTDSTEEEEEEEDDEVLEEKELDSLENGSDFEEEDEVNQNQKNQDKNFIKEKEKTTFEGSFNEFLKSKIK